MAHGEDQICPQGGGVGMEERSVVRGRSSCGTCPDRPAQPCDGSRVRGAPETQRGPRWGAGGTPGVCSPKAWHRLGVERRRPGEDLGQGPRIPRRGFTWPEPPGVPPRVPSATWALLPPLIHAAFHACRGAPSCPGPRGRGAGGPGEACASPTGFVGAWAQLLRGGLPTQCPCLC